jgi:hypothetical protein
LDINDTRRAMNAPAGIEGKRAIKVSASEKIEARMATLKIKDLRSVTIKILPNKKRVQLRFETAEAGPYESIEVELDSILALGFASETLKLLSPEKH